jgi:tRNA-dihydrouridine synthase
MPVLHCCKAYHQKKIAMFLLRYEDVYRLKQDRPELLIEINGGVKTFAETQEHLKHVDGVMIGREAYHNHTYWQSWVNFGI